MTNPKNRKPRGPAPKKAKAAKVKEQKVPLAGSHLVEIAEGVKVPAQLAIAVSSERWQLAEGWALTAKEENEVIGALGHVIAGLLQKIEMLKKDHYSFREEVAAMLDDIQASTRQQIRVVLNRVDPDGLDDDEVDDD